MKDDDVVELLIPDRGRSSGLHSDGYPERHRSKNTKKKTTRKNKKKHRLKNLRRLVIRFSLAVAISMFLSSQIRLLIHQTSTSTIKEAAEDDGTMTPDNAHGVEMVTSQHRRETTSTVLNLRWKDGCMYIEPRSSKQSTSPDGPREDPGTVMTTLSSLSLSSSSSPSSSHQKRLSTGIVVTVVIAPKNRQHMMSGRQQICDNLPNQWMYFLHPQQIDMLFLVHDTSRGWNSQYFINCMNLQHHHDYATSNNNSSSSSNNTNHNYNNGTRHASPIKQLWENLDGSKLETTQFWYQGPATAVSTGRDGVRARQRLPPIRIYVASTVVKYPKYIQQNPSLLELRKYGPKGCSARLTYLNGCRYYTQEMLHLQILQPTTFSPTNEQQQQRQQQQQQQQHDGYDYFIKMDTDIVFRKSPPFFLLQDMIEKNAVFAHAGEYHPWGDSSCAPGILDAISNYTKSMMTTTEHDENRYDVIPTWNRRICSSATPEMNRNADQYYGNFIIGSVKYFTSPAVLSFANYLSNYPYGFFRYKWGDQIMWHYAMGIFLGTSGRTTTTATTSTTNLISSSNASKWSNNTSDKDDDDDFTNYVVDYTDLRCKPNPKCWFSANYIDQYGPNASIQCSSDDEVFAHTKLSLMFATDNSKKPTAPIWYNDPSKQPLFQSRYPADCGS